MMLLLFSALAPATSLNASLTATLDYNLNKPESIEYDVTNNRLVVGSISTGRIIGIPLPLVGKPVYDASSVHTYFEGGTAGQNDSVVGTAGLQVDPADPCILYAAVGKYPAYKGPGTQIGVATINLCSGSPSRPAYFTDLTTLAKGYGSMCNDIAAPLWANGDLYVTDYLGNQLIRVRGQNSASPSFEVMIGSCLGCNGIEWLADGALLISQLNTFGHPHLGLYRYDTVAKTGALLTGTAPLAGDGIIFDASRQTLYSVVGGTQVDAVQSYDGWQTAVKVGVSVTAGCGAGGPATAAVLVGSDMYISCGANFQAGPYPITSLVKFAAQMAVPTSKLKGHYVVYGVDGAAAPPTECQGFSDGEAVPPSCCYGPQAPTAFEPIGDFSDQAGYCPVVNDTVVNSIWFPTAYCDANGVGYVKEHCDACGSCRITSAQASTTAACFKALDFSSFVCHHSFERWFLWLPLSRT